MSEINEIEELPEGNFPINLKLTNQYQLQDPRLMAEYNIYIKTGYFFGEINININLITYEYNIVI